MPFEPVGIDEDSHFPPRVEERLAADFAGSGDGYTKDEADARYPLKESVYTKTQSDATNNAQNDALSAHSAALAQDATDIDALQALTTNPGRLGPSALDLRYGVAEPDPRPTGRITFIGDSYMTGLGLSSIADRWPSVMAGWFGVPNTNVAQSGSGYVNVGAGGNFPSQAALVPADTDTVIVCGGINDAPLGTSQATITAAVAAIVSTIAGLAPTARVVFISPMWFQNDVSAELIDMDTKIRTAVQAVGKRYIEDAMFMRISRTDLAQGDGHPNPAGHIAIAGWVYDNLLMEAQPGVGYAHFIMSVAEFPITGPSVGFFAGKTLKNARRGWWNLRGTGVFYGGTLGFLEVQATAGYLKSVRNDIVSDDRPWQFDNEFMFYHSGGDLLLRVGYRPNLSGVTNVIPGGSEVYGRWMGYQ